MPTYRILDQDGVIVDKDREPPDISDEEVIKMYKDMVSGTVTILFMATSIHVLVLTPLQ